ncbi:hypothetical protein HMPREF0063_12245 [Aeromicrobium marinum DSM 15272]|uniref:Uncharacterized protein n=1 Tax=Aeromicrobium marinum DSM 15272 TaxID=585531 RepID=E2SCT3_9ACTN|nr:hypothetical protein [Aeromicrobium marinum]EFQ83036.1 hypothetical protein HMPREF0063_12245 [Aeromicrobium marinum DSM 15272]
MSTAAVQRTAQVVRVAFSCAVGAYVCGVAALGLFNDNLRSVDLTPTMTQSSVPAAP